VDLKDIKAIIDLMKKNSVSEFELEKQDFKIRLKRGVSGGGTVLQSEDAPVVASAITKGAIAALPSGAGTAQTAPASASNEVDIKSPMIGTFYRSPSPEAGSYVEVGTEVNPDTVVCIIEAMKVMNEIKAESRCRILKIVAENGRPVTAGQALFHIEPA
jgi:acetyl-CoA carboxylase biotin carboxyl carrier protein